MSCIATEEKNTLIPLPDKARKALSAIAANAKLSEEVVLGIGNKTRQTKNVVDARWKFICYMYINLGMSYYRIAQCMGRDHTSIMYACKKSGVETRGAEQKSKNKKIKVPQDSVVSVIPIVAASQDYVVLLGGKRRPNKGQKRGDCLVTWSSGKQEFISSQAAQEYEDLMGWQWNGHKMRG